MLPLTLPALPLMGAPAALAILSGAAVPAALAILSGAAVPAAPMLVPALWYQILAAALFAIGVLGVLFRRNILVIFMSVELMLNAANISFITFARQIGSLDGQVIVFFVLAVAAAEVAVGLAIIIDVFKRRGTIDLAASNLLKG